MAFVSDHFVVHEAAPGIHALIATDSGAAISNSTIADLGDKTIVIDTFMTLDAGDNLVEAVHALTGRGAFLVVNSHWHDDHTGSNQHFADVPIVSTRRTLELIVADAAATAEQYAEDLDRYRAYLLERAASATDEESKLRADRALRSADALFRNKERFRLTLPDLLIDDRLAVEGTDRAIEILTLGGGHTESDVFAWFPTERLISSGDLVWTQLHPRTQDGNPGRWAEILDQMADLDPTTIVPGHGEVGGADHVPVMAEYLRGVEQMVEEAVESGLGDDDIAALPVPQVAADWGGPARLFEGVRLLAEQRKG
jgi:glyoxylase-like metal-dependent hydrolase (beta-lactamase superfamily II)